MSTYIFLAIIVVVVAYAIYATAKRFGGGGGCHGGGAVKIKKKKLDNIKYQKTFHVEGMHCKNCKARVEEVIGDIHGVAGEVDLAKNQVTISYAEDVSDDVIRARVERAGYQMKNLGV